jgi:hypothetical protein
MIATRPAWAFRLAKERSVFARRASVTGGTAHVAFSYDKRGFTESKLFALDLETGSEKWSYTVEHVANQPLADADGTIYWSSFEGNVYALDVHGALLWKAPGTRSNIGVPRLLGNDRLVVPEIAGGARATWCLYRATGKTLWRFESGGHTCQIHCHGERMLQSSDSGATGEAALSCLAAADGTLVWSVKERGDFFNPFVLGDRVIVWSEKRVRVYSLAQGRLLAKLPLDPGDGALHVSPDSSPELLYLWCEHTFGPGVDAIMAVEPALSRRFLGGERLTLHERWKIREPRRLCAVPIAVPGAWLAYLTHDAVVCVLDRATGASVAEVPLKTRPSERGGLCVAGSRLVAVHGRDVFCFSFG